MTISPKEISSSTDRSKSGRKIGSTVLKKTALPKLGAIVKWKGEKWKIAKYLFAFPNEEVTLDPVQRIGPSKNLPLARIEELSLSYIEEGD